MAAQAMDSGHRREDDDEEGYGSDVDYFVDQGRTVPGSRSPGHQLYSRSLPRGKISFRYPRGEVFPLAARGLLLLFFFVCLFHRPLTVISRRRDAAKTHIISFFEKALLGFRGAFFCRLLDARRGGGAGARGVLFGPK
jgi:hypothetical protein